MLFLLFQLGSDHYAIDATQVEEVLPLVVVKQIPHAPTGVAGAINHRGTAVPVIDLSELALGRPARIRMSTRIVLVRYPDAGGTHRALGLIAERATETMRREPADFTPAGVDPEGAPYLGPVVADARGLIQWIDVATLLPEAVQAVLFQKPLEVP